MSSSSKKRSIQDVTASSQPSSCRRRRLNEDGEPFPVEPLRNNNNNNVQSPDTSTTANPNQQRNQNLQQHQSFRQIVMSPGHQIGHQIVAGLLSPTVRSFRNPNGQEIPMARLLTPRATMDVSNMDQAINNSMAGGFPSPSPNMSFGYGLDYGYGLQPPSSNMNDGYGLQSPSSNMNYGYRLQPPPRLAADINDDFNPPAILRTNRSSGFGSQNVAQAPGVGFSQENELGFEEDEAVFQLLQPRQVDPQAASQAVIRPQGQNQDDLLQPDNQIQVVMQPDGQNQIHDAAMNQVVQQPLPNRNQAGYETPPYYRQQSTPRSQRVESIAREMDEGRFIRENLAEARRLVEMDRIDRDQDLRLVGLQIEQDRNVIQGVAVVANQMNRQEIMQRDTHHRQNLQQHQDQMTQQQLQHQDQMNYRNNEQMTIFLTDTLRSLVVMSVVCLFLVLIVELSGYWYAFKEHPCQCLEALIWGAAPESTKIIKNQYWWPWRTDEESENYIDHSYLYWLGYPSPFQSFVGRSMYSVGYCWTAEVLVLVVFMGFMFSRVILSSVGWDVRTHAFRSSGSYQDYLE